jgi:hypothetical protein
MTMTMSNHKEEENATEPLTLFLHILLRRMKTVSFCFQWRRRKKTEVVDEREEGTRGMLLE